MIKSCFIVTLKPQKFLHENDYCSMISSFMVSRVGASLLSKEIGHCEDSTPRVEDRLGPERPRSMLHMVPPRASPRPTNLVLVTLVDDG